MAPAKGNKFAVGYGRPPNEGYSDPEVLELGKELLLWMEEQDNNPNSNIVHLSEWYSEIKGIARTQWQSICARECFIPYHDIAKDWMGKRIMKSERLSSSYGNRFLGIYFREVRDYERDVVEHRVDYEIKKKEEKGFCPNDPNISIAQKLIEVNAQQNSKMEQLQAVIDDLKSKAAASVQPSQPQI